MLREIARLGRSQEAPEQLVRLQGDYGYWGEQTCATDGQCATTCPVGINTGEYTKQLRALAKGDSALAVAAFVARHFSVATSFIWWTGVRQSGKKLHDQSMVLMCVWCFFRMMYIRVVCLT